MNNYIDNIPTDYEDNGKNKENYENTKENYINNKNDNSLYTLSLVELNFKRYELFRKLKDIMNEYKKIYNNDITDDLPVYISEGMSGVNLCLECGVDMGDINSRQLCKKWYCDGYK